MADLITNARARVALPGAAGSGADDTAINTLITACSKTIERFCRRVFASTAHDELYSGSNDCRLLLRNFPILSMQSVRYRPTTVLKVKNTSAANQQARVSITSSGITLVRVAWATTSTNAISFAAQPTLTALAAAVTALGNGWSASVVTGYENWPSADLYPPIQGAWDAAASREASVLMHTAEAAGYAIDAERGWLLRSLESSELEGDNQTIWPTGTHNFRVQYTAGWATVPEDVQEACALLVAYHFRLGPRETLLIDMPSHVRRLLAPYRAHLVG